MHKDGQKTKTIGLLVGEEGSLGATDAIIYESVHINSKLFSKPARPSRTASPSTPSMQDRLGLHSFRRCDEVEYLNAEEGETYTRPSSTASSTMSPRRSRPGSCSSSTT